MLAAESTNIVLCVVACKCKSKRERAASLESFFAEFYKNLLCVMWVKKKKFSIDQANGVKK